MSYFIFPRLTDEKQFEHLVADCYRALYPGSQVDEYGRRGQKQYGIDITVQMESRLCVFNAKIMKRFQFHILMNYLVGVLITALTHLVS